MGERLNWNSKSSGKPKICDLKIAIFINQKVLRFKVSVDDSSRVTVIYSIDELEHEELNLVRSNGSLVLGHILLEIIV